MCTQGKFDQFTQAALNIITGSGVSIITPLGHGIPGRIKALPVTRYAEKLC
jgi:hypothetical protein